MKRIIFLVMILLVVIAVEIISIQKHFQPSKKNYPQKDSTFFLLATNKIKVKIDSALAFETDTIRFEIGDFNGDGKIDTAFLLPPKTKKYSEFGECIGNCDCKIYFSDRTIPVINIKSCIGGQPVNEGDLNEDGADEIGILPNWWTSCWRAYYVYTLRNNRWRFAIEPISTHCQQWEEGVDAIQKDSSKKGYAIIKYSVIDNSTADFKVLTKSVKVER